MKTEAKKIQFEIQKGLEKVFPENLVEQIASSPKPLTIKLGADPSAPDLHLGHWVILKKLALLQKLGHTVIFLIGDFTARIGDPTGKSETRKPLSEEEVKKNAQTYEAQIFKILDPKKTSLVFNSHWLEKLGAADMIALTSKYTVSRMLERDDFHKRFKGEQSICIHEFLYPLFQGYDSVYLKNDIEIGGTDQTFNILMGRHLQKEYEQKPQGVMLMPLLEGLDGTQKMSKSLKNHIGLLDAPNDMYGKIMSLPDKLIIKYATLLTDLDTCHMQAEYDNGTNPKELKSRLAIEIVTQLHSKEMAESAKQEFEKVFSQNQIPTDMPEAKITQETRIDHLLVEHTLVPSKKEAHRLITQGGLEINGEKVGDPLTMLHTGKDYLIKAGKRRWLKICGE